MARSGANRQVRERADNDEQSLRVAACAIAVAKVCEATEMRGVG